MSFQKPHQVAEFENLICNSVQNFVNASVAIGDPLTSLAVKVKNAFLKNLDLIQFGLCHPQPAYDSQHMVAYSNVIKEIVESKEGSQKEFSNHFATVREGILALGWINVKPAPTQFIKDMKEAGEYYANRVLLGNKGNKLHLNWVNAWNTLICDLQDYVRNYFLTGMSWGAQAREGAAPPPPPPPPPQAFADLGSAGDGARQALLNDLNRGFDVMQNLRPVRRNGPAAAPSQSGRVSAAAAAPQTAVKVVRPPKFILEGRKWLVEHQKQQYGLQIRNDDMAQSLSMYSCEDTSVEVCNKINSVTIDSCKRTCVVLKGVISSVEVIRGDRLKIQCDGPVPLINLDNSDSIQVFVTPASRNVEIISSKATSCNVCLLETDGDYREVPIPEQIKSVLAAGDKLVSTVLEKN